MFMVPERWMEFMNTLKELVLAGEVSKSRIDDAVLRILSVKYEIGLFNIDFSKSHEFGTKAHRKTADQLAAKSIVVKKK